MHGLRVWLQHAAMLTLIIRPSASQPHWLKPPRCNLRVAAAGPPGAQGHARFMQIQLDAHRRGEEVAVAFVLRSPLLLFWPL